MQKTAQERRSRLHENLKPLLFAEAIHAKANVKTEETRHGVHEPILKVSMRAPAFVKDRFYHWQYTLKKR